MNKGGVAVELSEDHKPDLPTERSRVLASGHNVEDGRVDGIIAISRALGDWEYKNPKLAPEKMAVSGMPEVSITPITPDLTYFICACDGIWDCMTSQGACDFIALGKAKMETFTPPKSATKVVKKPSLKDPKEKKTKTELKMENSISNSKFNGLATITEMMMD